MTNTKKYLIAGSILGGVALLGYSIYYYFTRQTELIKNFTYNILDIKTTQFDTKMIKGSMTLEFGNTSDIELLVNEFVVDFYINNQYVGFMQDEGKFVILPNSKTPITFQFSINPQDVVGNIMNILLYSSASQDAAFKVKGFARIKSGFINMSVPVEFESSLSEMLK